jgi:hopanoid biosynthesis associated RND transporter like protein HpnN
MSPTLKNLPRKLVHATVTWSARRPWLVLLGGVLLTAFALYYTANHLSIDTDTSDMIDVRLPHRQANLALAKAFPHLPGDVVVYAESAHAGLAEDAADALVATLRKRPDIAHALSQPGGGEYFATHGLLYLSPDELWTIDERLAQAAPLLGTLAHDQSLSGLFQTMSTALAQPLDAGQQQLLRRMFDRLATTLEAPDGRAVHWQDELFPDRGGLQRAFVLIDPTRAKTSFQPEQDAVDALHGPLGQMAKDWPEVSFHVTGPVPMNSEELVTVADDAGLTTLLSFGAVALVLIWGLRSPVLVVAVLVTLACGLVWTAALATWLVGSLNIISVCFAVLFIGMGVDFGIQFVMRYLEECGHGKRGAEALGAAADGAGGALVLAAVGAAISFAAFVPTSYRGLAQLGVISSFSMALALVANITLLPALLSLVGVSRFRRRGDDARPSRLAALLGRHGTTVLVGSGLLALVSAALMPQVVFDPNPANLKDRNSPSVQAFLALANDPISTPYTIEILSPSLAAADASAAKIAELPSVDKVITLNSLVPEGQTEKLDIIDGMRTAMTGVIDVAPATLPSAQAEAAALQAFMRILAERQAGFSDAKTLAAASRLSDALKQVNADPAQLEAQMPALRAQLLGDLPQTLQRLRKLLDASAVTLNDLPDDLKARYLAPDGRARVEVYPRQNLNDNAAMRQFVQEVQGADAGATGAPVELVIGSDVVIDACFKASLGALILTILLHALVLHGWVDALLVAAPLVLAMLLTLATSVLSHFPLNFANIIALPLLIGLNNAYGAYLVVRRKHTEGVNPLLESSTPRAVWFSGMTAVASFGTLAVSKHPGMAGMGVLISLSLAYALLSALIMLPALMAAVERWQARHHKS